LNFYPGRVGVEGIISLVKGPTSNDPPVSDTNFSPTLLFHSPANKVRDQFSFFLLCVKDMRNRFFWDPDPFTNVPSKFSQHQRKQDHPPPFQSFSKDRVNLPYSLPPSGILALTADQKFRSTSTASDISTSLFHCRIFLLPVLNKKP